MYVALLATYVHWQEFIVEYRQVPYDALTYLVGESNYGGKVTDQRDRRCLLSILKSYLNPTVLDSKYKFGNVATFSQKLTYNEYLTSIKVYTLSFVH